jgi:hypothetical protein
MALLELFKGENLGKMLVKWPKAPRTPPKRPSVYG